MSRCGEPYPEEPALLCEAADTPHEWHTAIDRSQRPPAGVDWINTDYTSAMKVRTKGAREEHKRSVRERVREYNGGPPVEAEQAWREHKGEWIEEAKRVLHRFCQQHSRPFTTPEDVWPLLDTPGEMRAFSVVVQHALRRRWIIETSSKRLSDEYVTKDGTRFAMNKIVPVYTSRIAVPVDLG